MHDAWLGCPLEASINDSGLCWFGFGLTHSGASYSAEELEALAEVFRKYRVLVLADEIYGPIQFEYEYRSLTEFYPEVCVCVCVWAGSCVLSGC